MSGLILNEFGRPSDGAATDFALPPPIQFGSIFGGAQATYFHGGYDQALERSREDALLMRNDCFLMGLLQERKLGTAGLRWHLEIDDERDPYQVMVRDHLETQARAVRHLPRDVFMPLMEAIWFGRSAVQVTWKWAWKTPPPLRFRIAYAGLPSSSTPQDGQVPTPSLVPQPQQDVPLGPHRTLSLNLKAPVHGDKIGHRYSGMPYVLVNVAEGEQLAGAETVLTTLTRGLLLKGTWRERFLIHAHGIEDPDYFDAQRGDMIYGVGVRSTLFWHDWLKREYLAWLTDFLERYGLGLTIVSYDESNPASKAAAQQVVNDLNGRKMAVLVPIVPGQESLKDKLVRIETPQSAAEVILKLMRLFDHYIRYYVLGDDSGEEGRSKGGDEIREMSSAKWKMSRLDALNLADTLTSDYLDVQKYWTFPWADFPVRWVFDVDSPDVGERIGAITKLWEIGVEFDGDKVRGLVGESKPGEGANVVSKAKQIEHEASVKAAHQDPNRTAAGTFDTKGKTVEEEDKSGGETPKPAGNGQANGQPAQAEPQQFSKSESHSYSSTQFDLPADVAEEVRKLAATISDEDLAEGGREKHPHLTLKYGLHTQEAKEVERLLEEVGPVTVRLGPISVFPAKEASAQKGSQYEVVKIDVEGFMVRGLNRHIADGLEHTDTHSVYKPHVCLAYVKPGLGKKYAGRHAMEGQEITFHALTFSPSQGDPVRVPLTGPIRFVRDYKSRMPGKNPPFESAHEREPIGAHDAEGRSSNPDGGDWTENPGGEGKPPKAKHPGRHNPAWHKKYGGGPKKPSGKPATQPVKKPETPPAIPGLPVFPPSSTLPESEREKRLREYQERAAGKQSLFPGGAPAMPEPEPEAEWEPGDEEAAANDIRSHVRSAVAKGPVDVVTLANTLPPEFGGGELRDALEGMAARGEISLSSDGKTVAPATAPKAKPAATPPQPTLQPVAAPQPPAPYPAPTGTASLHDALAKSALMPEMQAEYKGYIDNVVGRMPPKARERFERNVKGAQYFEGIEELNDAIFMEAPETDRQRLGEMRTRNARVGGTYNPGTGVFRLDGKETQMPSRVSENQGPEEVYAHEFGHAIDGMAEGGLMKPGWRISEGKAWRAAWEKEIKINAYGMSNLTRYGGTIPAEGFAEFARLIYGMDPETGKSWAAENLPMCYAVWQAEGLV